MTKRILTHKLSEPLDGATVATIDISTPSGNLTVDKLAQAEALLASGTLQYMENREVPASSVDIRDGQPTLTLETNGMRRPWFRLPWQACNAATEWCIHVNPKAVSTLRVHSGGGNIKMDLSGAAVSHLQADTGGGNMDVVLPENVESLNATIRSGAGNVTVELGNGVSGAGIVDAMSGAGNVAARIPSGLAARIHATSGMGKVVVDPCFSHLEKGLYQSPPYDSIADKVDITLHSGAGDVIVEVKYS